MVVSFYSHKLPLIKHMPHQLKTSTQFSNFVYSLVKNDQMSKGVLQMMIGFQICPLVINSWNSLYP